MPLDKPAAETGSSLSTQKVGTPSAGKSSVTFDEREDLMKQCIQCLSKAVSVTFNTMKL